MESESENKLKRKRELAAKRAKAYRLRKKKNNEIKKVKEPNKKSIRLEFIPRKTTISSKKVNKLNPVSQLEKFMNDKFFKNKLNTVCDICDRLWWSNEIINVSKISKVFNFIRTFDEKLEQYALCKNCYASCKRNQIPLMSKYNGFVYPPIPSHLPELDIITERLISPRLPFLTTRQIRWFPGAKRLVGQIINVPVDVNSMVNTLPRDLDDDFAINVNLKRNKLHKSVYLQGCVKKSIIKEWLKYLMSKTLYKRHEIKINESFMKSKNEVINELENEYNEVFKKVIDGNIPIELESETMLSMQQNTLIWGDEMTLILYPTQNKQPLALSFDGDAEELSFPSIYYGEPREFKTRVNAYCMAFSEIRRADRRGVKPDHILYMAAKIMRLRIIDGYRLMFRNPNFNRENITRSKLNDSDFVKDMLDRNMSFFKGIPNSVQYWQTRKKDLFAMLRQLGKPTIFLTLSASEIYWTPLLKSLIQFRNKDLITNISDEEIESLSSFWRATIVNEDPVVCCLYFEKLVNTFFSAFKNKKNGPFGKYFLVDYFKRIEFQHRGSPHAHCLLWLANAPKEPISENMPKTVQLIDELISVDGANLPTIRSVQTHRHTHTCYRKNSNKCRFNAPFWPMHETKILLPAVERDLDKVEIYKNLQKKLEETEYLNFEDFLQKNLIYSIEEYLEILRNGILRATVFFKRDLEDIWTNPYNSAILNVLNSNMDIQYVLDEYSCATYVAEYVNKSNRGFSALHRELIQLKDKFPDADYEALMKELGKKTLNNIEMSTQEAAWFLLKQPMSRTSRYVIYIPTQHPSERFASIKSKKQMDKENIGESSTDIWNKNIIQYYQQRPESLFHICLAEFAAWYYKTKKNHTNDNYEEQNSDDENVSTINFQYQYKRRSNCCILRWRNYDPTDTLNFIREIVLLFYPFKNEELNLLNNDNYLRIYEENKELILNNRKAYDTGINFNKILEHISSDNNETNENSAKFENEKDKRIVNIIGEDNVYMKNPQVKSLYKPNDEDLNSVDRISIVQKVSNVMTHSEFCSTIRTLNCGQYKICLELINRLVYNSEQGALQIFFTGPAGAGKTHVIKVMMEIINRFSQRHDSNKCAYLACATTGKAAINIDGTTVHTAFNIPINNNRMMHMKASTLHSLRCDLKEVNSIIIDEISMMSFQMLCNVDYVLRAVGEKPSQNFGGFNIILCGDLRQLPPVRASPIYRRPANCLQQDMLWQNLLFYDLTEIVRQSDKVFSSILTKIGNGLALRKREIKLLNDRFVNEEDIADMRDAVRLFHKNQDVDNYNYIKLNVPEAVAVLAEDDIKNYETEQQLKSAQVKVDKLPLTDTANMPKKLLLLLNTPYILTQNIDKTDKLVNGSYGYLRFIEYDEKDLNRVKRLWIEFTNDRSGATRRLETKFHASQLNIKDTCTPICRRSGPINLGSNILKGKRTQFPITPANALTVHKSQGGTYEKIVFEYNKNLHTSLVYVGLSRATSIAGLYLTNKDKDHNFYHVKDNVNYHELQNEFKRLDQVRLKTVWNQANNFIENSKTVQICYMNVQSLKMHHRDIVKDDVIKMNQVLALSETWLDDEELDIAIEGYRCISRRKRNNTRAGGVAIYESLSSSLQLCEKVDFEEFKHTQGDVCCVRIMTKNKIQFYMLAVYANCGTPFHDLTHLLHMAFKRFYNSDESSSIPEGNNLSECPVILCGDLNVNFSSTEGKKLVQYVKEMHGVDLLNDGMVTTRNNTSIDYIFGKNITIDILPYVSYFSIHRPILCTVTK